MARTLGEVIAIVPGKRRAKIAAAQGHKLIAEEQKRIAVEIVATLRGSEARDGA